MNQFLPMSRQEMEDLPIQQMDFVYVTGDAYVDHPSFGAAIICRLLQSRGYQVGISRSRTGVTRKASGIRRTAAGLSGKRGNMDSMVNHYTVAKKRRHQDAYSPGGKMGLRPDRAVTVYGNLIRRSYKKTPVILGGIEASLRRLAHYDYWEDRLRRSVLLDSGADLISYGMGEHSILEIAQALDSGIPVGALTYIPGTVFHTDSLEELQNVTVLPSYEEMTEDRMKYAESFAVQYRNTDPIRGNILAESYGNRGYVVQNPPAMPLSQEEMDDVYDLPYQRTWHPRYEKEGGIPAFREIRFSLTSNRGCFGGCNFCALTFHQGRMVQTRSHESLKKEAEGFLGDPLFKGYIHDVGGPTADFRQPSCEKQRKHGVCENRQCLFPSPCPNLKADHRDYVELLRELREIPGVKKVFVRSGIRFDYVLADRDRTFLRELVQHHISGQLRVAPEHVSDAVLACMGKPRHQVYEEFLREYNRENQKTERSSTRFRISCLPIRAVP